MGKIIGLIIIATLIGLLFYFSKDTSKKEKKISTREEAEELVDRLKLKLIKLREEAKNGKEEAIKELKSLEEDLKVAEQLKKKYK